MYWIFSRSVPFSGTFSGLIVKKMKTVTNLAELVIFPAHLGHSFFFFFFWQWVSGREGDGLHTKSKLIVQCALYIRGGIGQMSFLASILVIVSIVSKNFFKAVTQ